MKVLKFGGSSVGSPERIERVLALLRRHGPPPSVAVFSAFGDTTDGLEEAGRLASGGGLADAQGVLAGLARFHESLGRALFAPGPALENSLALVESHFARLRAMAGAVAALGEFSPLVRDSFLGTGERLSSAFMASFLRERGLPAAWVDAREVIVTDAAHTEASPRLAATRRACRSRLLPLLRSGRLVVLPGFLGRSESGEDTTLGRGGSDFTAALVGAALDAEEIQIWTDVDGILTADPSLVPKARSLSLLSYREASELAFFGARVLHPKTLEPAVARGIPVRILNTLRPRHPGTRVLGEVPPAKAPLKSIAYKEAMCVVNLSTPKMFKAPDFLARLSAILVRHGLAPDLMATSEVSVALAFQEGPAVSAALKELEALGPVERRTGEALVCLVGEELRNRPGLAGAIMEATVPARVSMVSFGGSGICFGFLVDEESLPGVVRRLHRRFFERARAGRRDGAKREAGHEAGDDAVQGRRARSHGNRGPEARGPAPEPSLV
ncbi:MAG: aspartate kinase [Acidobacteriota bacterium]